MERPFEHLHVEQLGTTCCVRLRERRIAEDALEELSAELARLVDEEGCRRVVLNLGPGDLDCLYSVFLAKLINLQRRLEAASGHLALAGCSDNTMEVFRLTGLERHFKFFPDEPSAVQGLA